jgi:uncharacterized protein YwqG
MTTNNLTTAELQLFNRLTPVKKTAWLPMVETRMGTVLNSKFSGIALLDQQENWPCCGNCQQAMQLFLQLNSNELPEAARTVFGGGILQVFYCTNETEQCEIECEAYAPFAKSTLLRILDPTKVIAKNLDVSPVVEALTEKVIIGWQATDDYPNVEELADLGLDISDADMECLSEHGYPKAGDKLSGWPDWVQGVEYPNCPDCGETMKYIFQIDSNDHLDYMFGDTGCAHITQCPQHPNRLAIAWACC